jgi:hypothetical protein
MKASSDRYWSPVLLLLLLAADLLFVGLQVLHSFGYAGDPRFSLGAERGYAEIYQYVKFFWTAALLSWFAVETREGLYGMGALLFAYFLLDDALGIHENAGFTMAEGLGVPSVLGLRGQDLGELGVSVLVGLFFLGLGGWAYRRGTPRARQLGRFVVMGVVALAVFGIGADLLHQLAESRWPWTDLPLVVMEDGGEMIVVSVITWFVYAAAGQELTPLHVPCPLDQSPVAGTD